MTQGGTVSTKDEKQKKDGHTTGLLRASPRKDGTQKRIVATYPNSGLAPPS
ncbi:MAG: hypothetical protein RR280_06415 [Bacteroidaceae bacterium]